MVSERNYRLAKPPYNPAAEALAHAGQEVAAQRAESDLEPGRP
jgi:hypothetical protein